MGRERRWLRGRLGNRMVGILVFAFGWMKGIDIWVFVRYVMNKININLQGYGLKSNMYLHIIMF